MVDYESEGALQQRMRELTRKVLLALMAVIAVVSVDAVGLALRGGTLVYAPISSGSCRCRFWCWL